MNMAETLVSVKKTSSSAGRPKGKKHYVILFRWEDVKTFEKDTDGITVTAFAFAEGKKPIAVYGTSSTIKSWDTLTGSADAKGYLHHTAWESPGDTKEMAICRNTLVNEDLGSIVILKMRKSLVLLALLWCSALMKDRTIRRLARIRLNWHPKFLHLLLGVFL